jgi:hypothetical protein
LGCSLPGFKLWMIRGVTAVALGVATYLGSHRSGVITPAFASTCLSIASGLSWALSASLPDRRRKMSVNLNRLAACLTTMSGICLLP